MKVYVAASSAEIDRARAWVVALDALEIPVTSTWIDTIDLVGSGNPRDAHPSRRRGWSETDLDQVESADVFWFLVPPLDKPTRGAWVELGYALGCLRFATGADRARRRVFCSGDTAQSIFCAMGREFAADRDAFAAICLLAGKAAS